MQQRSSRTVRSCPTRFVCALAALGATTAACGGGPAGPPGTSCAVVDNGDGTKTISCEDGTSATVRDGLAGGSCTVTENEDGTKTIRCTDGTTVTIGSGTPCWDLDGDGEPDVEAEDRNGDGLVNVEDCQGRDGTGGTDGTHGASCWDTNGNGLPDLPGEDRNGDGAVTVLDCDGASTGPLLGRVLDASTFAGLAGVTVTTFPETTTVTTDASGAFHIDEVPMGMYLVIARGTTLDGRLTDTSAGPVSIVARGGGALDVYFARIPASWLANLRDYHDSTATALFTNANCVLCHTDRAGEVSLDPVTRPFHAMTAHALGCTTCHDRTVDFRHESAAQLRKNVSTSRCTSCHRNFPVLP